MQTNMRREIDEIPDATARLLDQSRVSVKKTGAALRAKDPAFFVTIARGSSDHAALFLKYAIELSTGRPVASLGPSLASIYGAKMHLQGAASIAISQSGKSPDIVAMAEAATKAGAVTIALTNTLPSPISEVSTHPLDILAGPEIAVAATKSYVNSIVAGLAILAEWTDDTDLKRAVADLPEQFTKAVKLDWQMLADELGDAESLFVLGRGPALAIASDAAEGSVTGILDGLSAKGALAFVTSSNAKAAKILPFVETGHPITDALTLILPFYGFVEAWSRSRGLNPDAPVALKKVTETR